MSLFAKLTYVARATTESSVEHFDAAGRPAQVISLATDRVRCQTCGIGELCLPAGLNPDEMKQLDGLIVHRIIVRKRNAVYRAGEPFHALYAIRNGSLKTAMDGKDGREQVLGYHIPGDIFGIDGIALNRHGANAIALEDTEVCALPFAAIEDLARTSLGLQRNVAQFMSREVMRNHNAIFMLGSMAADERLIVFLLSLADRHGRPDYKLTLTRQDIASHLGLRIETVSRHFSQLQDAGLIEVRGRSVKLLDPAAMKDVISRRG